MVHLSNVTTKFQGRVDDKAARDVGGPLAFYFAVVIVVTLVSSDTGLSNLGRDGNHHIFLYFCSSRH
jgi:hypothetical protein